jgi:hypothetical protein
MSFLSARLPEADPDAMAWTGLVRNKRGIGTATREVVTAMKRAHREAEATRRRATLFDVLDDQDGVQ